MIFIGFLLFSLLLLIYLWTLIIVVPEILVGILFGSMVAASSLCFFTQLINWGVIK